AKAKEKEKKAAPRPPADPRLKVLKKFHGKFLPRGPLRDRLKALMERWNSGADHGGVTVEELKSLHHDWKAARAKPARLAQTSRCPRGTPARIDGGPLTVPRPHRSGHLPWRRGRRRRRPGGRPPWPPRPAPARSRGPPGRGRPSPRRRPA